MSASRAETSVMGREGEASQRAWWSYLLWVLAAAILGFAVPAVFAGLLRLPRSVYLIPYFVLVGLLLRGYWRWSNLSIGARLRYHWVWGVVGAIVAGFFASRTVLMQTSSPAPRGLELALGLLWLGLAYGVVDALFLSILPLSAVWQALAVLGWTKRWPGRIAVGCLAVAASLLIIAVYHLGYPEFRGPQVALVVVGVGVQSLLTLLTGNPLVALVGHTTMHITAVLYGLNSVSQLPPHY